MGNDKAGPQITRSVLIAVMSMIFPWPDYSSINPLNLWLTDWIIKQIKLSKMKYPFEIKIPAVQF
jgi:hypothetical protein